MARVTIRLPKPMDAYSACKEFAEWFMACEFGGFTRYHADGGWRSGGPVEREAVTVIEAYTDMSPEAARDTVTDIAEGVHERNDYDEDAIMVTVGDEQILVD